MEAITLTEKHRWVILNALHAVADFYHDTASSHALTGPHLEPLRQRFDMQASYAMELYDLVESAESITFKGAK